MKGNYSILKKKKNWITFVGKLNRAKGYDVFCKAIKKVLNKNPSWEAKIIGDEKREKINLIHKNADILGFLNHKSVLNIFEKSSREFLGKGRPVQSHSLRRLVSR